MSITRPRWFALPLFVVVVASTARAQTFDFEGLPPTLVPPTLTITQGGLAASFSVLDVPGVARSAIVIDASTLLFPATSSLLTGNMLLFFGEGPQPQPVIDIAFGRPLHSLSVNVGGMNTDFTMAIFRSGSLVGSTTIAGSLVSGLPVDIYEGTLFFSGSTFDAVSIASGSFSTLGSDTSLGIDNIVATVATVAPEPSSVALLLVAAVPLGVLARRRRTKLPF